MPFRIEIGLKRGVPDARGRGVVSQARAFLHLSLRSCVTRDVYKVDVHLPARQKRRILEAFADPVTTRAKFGRLAPPRFDWLVEIGFKPGVTDNVGHTAQALVEDRLNRRLAAGEGVYTSVQYFLRGANLTREGAEHVAHHLLANPLIQCIEVFSEAEWAEHPIDESVPAIRDESPLDVQTYDLSVRDEELIRISREGILSLRLEEMHAIRDHFRSPDHQRQRREAGLPAQPTDVELECLAQTWSEHCKHKIFAGRVHYIDEEGNEEWIDSLFKTYIRASTEQIAERVDWLVSVFVDNAGIIRFNDRFHLAFKVETHNTPSALDPYGGAITGIVGCNRDPMGTGIGCELLCNTWGYCFGSPFYDGQLPEGLFHPRRIRDGVHRGVIDGGNQSGIPYARGFEVFDDRFIGKPLVYCGTVGRIPTEVRGVPSEKKEVCPGDVVVMVGGRIGKDGIHGATFSSEELRQESPSQAVQIGDPITQRMMYEFLLEARDRALYRAITDNGAGGLSSSVGEMSRLSGGAEIDLAEAPLKYPGLQPWEILVSESQERMTLAVAPETLTALLDLAAHRDVEATAMGTFTDSGRLVVRHGERVVADLDMSFLHDGCPGMVLEARWAPPSIPPPRTPRKGRRNRALTKLLRALNICSKEHKARMYDHEVKGLSVVKPFTGVHANVPSDATVMRVEHDGREGVVIAEAINPFYSDIDTYPMMASTIDLAVRRIVSAGGSMDRLAGLDNFCWPDPVVSESTPDGAYKMAQLVRANRALFDVTTAYDVPCISGKDSMKNDSVRGGQKISIPPTVLFSTIGKIEDVGRAVTMYFKQPGDRIYVVGTTRKELGASEYYRMLAHEQGTPTHSGGELPVVERAAARRTYRAMNRAAEEALLGSSHTPGPGGLGVGLALASIGGSLGAHVYLARVPQPQDLDDDALLFAESNSRFIITCAPENAARLEKVLDGVPCAHVGEVTSEPRLLLHGSDGAPVIDLAVAALTKAFTETLHGI